MLLETAAAYRMNPMHFGFEMLAQSQNRSLHKVNTNADRVHGFATSAPTGTLQLFLINKFNVVQKVRVVLTDRRGRVLLGRTRDGACRWGLPGGGIEPEDYGNVLATAEREVAEETGARSCSQWRIAFVDEQRRTSVCAARPSSDRRNRPCQHAEPCRACAARNRNRQS